MNIPDVSEVQRRLGPRVTFRTAAHWVRGRRGLAYLVTDTQTGRRSVFKWCNPEELVCWRDLLPGAPVSTPELYRWWDAEAGLPAAVEMEFIPSLASPVPCYRFSPRYLRLTDPAWRTTRLQALVTQIGRMHALWADARRQEESGVAFARSSPGSDLEDWHHSLRKLNAVIHLPGAEARITFWASREQHYERVLRELYAFPTTWIWADAKWDHVGCRADGSVVVLEWSTRLGPGGSDLYLLLFEPAARRKRLQEIYLDAADGSGMSRGDLERWVRLGLARACYVHGPGQACLSLRGVLGGGSTPEEKRAWRADAAVTARWLQADESAL